MTFLHPRVKLLYGSFCSCHRQLEKERVSARSAEEDQSEEIPEEELPLLNARTFSIMITGWFCHFFFEKLAQGFLCIVFIKFPSVDAGLGDRARDMYREMDLSQDLQATGRLAWQLVGEVWKFYFVIYLEALIFLSQSDVALLWKRS